MANRILFYENEYYMLSNFSSHAVEYGGVLYMTPEHAYQSAKFDDREIKDKIFTARSSFQAKEIAKQYETEFQRSDWDNIRISVMENIICAKIKQHDDVREALLKSGDSEIVENSPDDYFWGSGSDGTGQNEVGKAWMRIRDELRSDKF